MSLTAQSGKTRRSTLGNEIRQAHYMATMTQTRRGGRLWRHRAFMLFWSGETVSLFGTQITMLALPLTAVLTLHATAAQLGWVRFAEAFPYVLFTLIFGAW